MFEQILKELKTKYKDLGLSENVLKATAEFLSGAVKEESEIRCCGGRGNVESPAVHSRPKQNLQSQD